MKILSRFRFALNEGGISPLLGKAEMVLTHTSTFAPLNLKATYLRADQRRRGRSRRPPAAALRDTTVAPESAVLRVAYDAGQSPQLVVDPGGVLLLAEQALRGRRSRSEGGISGRPLPRSSKSRTGP